MTEVNEANNINSRRWWDEYFRTEWQKNRGSEQTRHFMTRLITNLPASEIAFLKTAQATVLDWGCAFGEGVALLAATFPNATVSGLDFASVAIDEAKAHFPQYEFIESDSIPREFDIILCSNCLEHFSKPLELLSQHLKSCRRFYVGLVPYKERYPLLEQHESQFNEDSFPQEIEGFTRIFVAPIDVDPFYWNGQQLLVVYASPSYLKVREVSDGQQASRLKHEVELQLALMELNHVFNQRDQLLAQANDVTSRLREAEEAKHVNEQDRERLEQRLREIEAAHTASQKDNDRLEQRLREVEAMYAEVQQHKGELEVQVRALDSHLNDIISTRMWRFARFYWDTTGPFKRSLKTMRGRVWHTLREIYRATVPHNLRIKLRDLRHRMLWRLGESSGREQLEIAANYLRERSSKGQSNELDNGTFDVIILSIIEFEGRYQRPQQIATHFAQLGHRVFYVNGAEYIPNNSVTPYRITSLRQGVFGVHMGTDRPPAIYSSIIDTYNQDRFSKCIEALRKDCEIHAALLIVHLPFWTPLALQWRDRYGWAINYDCMDEWDGFPLIGKDILDAEQQLVRKSDIVTVTAQRLFDKWSDHAQTCLLVRNAVDVDFFTAEVRPNRVLGDVKHPVIGFYGGIAEWIDLELLEFLAKERPNWSIVLLGDTFVDVSKLEKLPNIHLLGRQPYETMPQYLYHFDVCLIPFRKNKITDAVDPVKLYEYISAGKPVVATRTDELLSFKDYIYLADGYAEFLQQIEEALAENDVEILHKRMTLAQRNDWDERVEQIKGAVRTLFPKISIIIVTYQNADLTRSCIESIFRNTTYPNFEVIVVDNASTDGTRNYLRFLSTQPDDVHIILNGINRGFAAANNQGIKAATGDRIVLLNNDTVVPRGWLWRLNRYLDQPEIGLVGPVSNFVGNEARIDVDYDNLEDMEIFAARYVRDHEGKSFEIEVLAMYCVAARRDVIDEIGLLDEEFGIGMFEDDDYSIRVKRAGYRLVCAQDVFVHHFGQAAFRELLKSGEYQEIWARNQSYFEKKWDQEWTPHKAK